MAAGSSLWSSCAGSAVHEDKADETELASFVVAFAFHLIRDPCSWLITRVYVARSV